jgi:hypothetical protein
MATEVVHKVVKLEEQTNNLPPYRWYGQCLCGFASRMATEDLVQSQLNAHLTNHGVVASVLHTAPTPAGTTDTGKPTGTWTPLGAKTGKTEVPVATDVQAGKGPLGGLTPLGGSK